jgi:hypothetical protein
MYVYRCFKNIINRSAVLLVSMCHAHACVNKISVFWMYEMTASRSDGTGRLKQVTLYITYNTIGCTACLYETFQYLNNCSYPKWITERSAVFFSWQRDSKCIFFI